jgi:hypothetical protein
VTVAIADEVLLVFIPEINDSRRGDGSTKITRLDQLELSEYAYLSNSVILPILPSIMMKANSSDFVAREPAQSGH